ncbi:MAG: 5-(carboxyamino)imidazole ribonucleotide synthase [Nocardioidaceae bacterium]|nr:5-(carboxyamino)imidazole ribonucleotide synthase [Nocardioidaceae bacterium]
METPVVGVVGAGQLARMMQQAAIPLGVPLRLLAETASSSAAQVIADSQVGDYADLDTLRAWASGVDVVTFDHEHVPTAHLEALAVDGVACRPGPAALVHAQDKVVMRKRLAELEVPCPRNRVVDSAKAVADFAADGDGWPVVLKTATGGYDGKGVWIVDDSDQAAGVIRVASAAAVLLAEDRVDFVRELSAVVARAPSGQIAAYPVVETTQTNGVCTEVTSPAPDLEPVLALEAQQVAMTIAAELDVTGILAVELFETRDGRIMVNELAMRPHNTGHWTIDGAVTSQFENHLRAVLDLPLGSPKARVRWTVMVNILGSSAPPLFDGYLHVQARDPEIRVHLYGKDVTPGRKVGHVTAYGDSLDEVKQRARHAASWFEGKLSDDGDEG